MGQRHRPKRKEQLSPLTRDRGPSAGRAYGEEDVLGPLVAARAQPSSKRLGSHLPAAAVEEHGHGGCPALLPDKPLEHGLFCSESLRLTARKCGATVEVNLSEIVESVFGSIPGANMGEREEHGRRISHASGMRKQGDGADSQKREDISIFGIVTKYYSEFHILPNSEE
jgi:hypothetical protein